MTSSAIGIHVHPQLKLGLRPPLNKPSLMIRDFLDIKAALVFSPSDDNVDFAGLKFDLYGNDQYGDCGPTDICNNVRGESFIARDYTEPNQNDCFDLYRRSGNPNFDPSTGTGDNGVDMQTMLEALLSEGIGDGRGGKVKPLAFAKIDVTDGDAIRAAINKFNFVSFGALLTAAQQAQSSNSNPVWDYVANSPEWGGHAFLGGGYDNNNVINISWGTKIAMTKAFVDHQLQEAWLILWPWNVAKLTGEELAALASAYSSLTGRDFPPLPNPSPIPDPPSVDPPTPVPPQPPTPPVDVDDQLARVAKHWVAHRWHRASETRDLRGALTDWMDHHYPSNGNATGRHRTSGT